MKNNFIYTTILAIALSLTSISVGFADVLSDAITPITAPASTSISTTPTNTYRTLNIPGSPQQSTVATEIGADGKKTGNIITSTLAEDGSKSVVVKNEKTGEVSSARSEADGSWSGDANAANVGQNLDGALGQTKTITTEKVPGAKCVCYKGADCTKVETRKYECTSGKGLSGFQEVFAMIIRFVVNMVLLSGVLAIVGLGIAWSFAGGDDVKMKSSLKKWAINIIIGLIILFMFRYILLFLAPWVYQ